MLQPFLPVPTASLVVVVVALGEGRLAFALFLEEDCDGEACLVEARFLAAGFLADSVLLLLSLFGSIL